MAQPSQATSNTHLLRLGRRLAPRLLLLLPLFLGLFTPDELHVVCLKLAELPQLLGVELVLW